MTVAVRVVATLLLVAGVVGCSGGDDSSGGGDGGAAPDLHGRLLRSTLSETRRALRMDVYNDGDQDVRLGSIQLSSPLFESVPPEERDALVRAGGAATMPLPLGDARCDGDSDADDAEESVELVTDVDGETMHVPLQVVPAGVVDELHTAECQAAGVADSVELRLGDVWAPTGPRTIQGQVELSQRREGVTAALDELRDNMIFTLDAADGRSTPWVEVSDEEPAGTVAVTVEATRCDPHGRIEYKRTFKFYAWVAIGDEDPVRVDVEAQEGSRRALEELLTSCVESIGPGAAEAS
jgi:hypothetical protein